MVEEIPQLKGSFIVPSRLYRSQFLPISIEEAWRFFSSPSNLRLITPEELGFVIVNASHSDKIEEGDIINYKVTPIKYFRMRWRTEISEVNKPFRFVDEQRIGPYKSWKHTHTFEKVDDGVLMKDEVVYELPFNILGKVVSNYVRRKLDAIFDYRNERIEKLIADGVFH